MIKYSNRIIIFPFLVLFLFSGLFACGQRQTGFALRSKADLSQPIIPGAYRMEHYIHLLEGKRVAVVANHTSMVGSTHLVDTLLSRGVNILKIFSPEHGFRGEAAAGKLISDSVDAKTGLPMVSLYGKKKKPSLRDISGLDIIIFDIQDVGVRFYTYISTLFYVMEAAQEAGVRVFVLDRPNPNSHYVAGPVLKKEFKSFIGIAPIPLVYGMTIGEFALMVNGEKWLQGGEEVSIRIIGVQNYDHNRPYDLPIKPSPNLPDMLSVYLYPSLGLLEGSVVSIGRGTDRPFSQIGHPDLKEYSYTFTPRSVNAAPNPKFQDRLCYGKPINVNVPSKPGISAFSIKYLMEMYTSLDKGEEFFRSSFDKLAGTDALRKMMLEGKGEEYIMESWQADLDAFMPIRQKYLLYYDFPH